MIQDLNTHPELATSLAFRLLAYPSLKQSHEYLPVNTCSLGYHAPLHFATRRRGGGVPVNAGKIRLQSSIKPIA